MKTTHFFLCGLTAMMMLGLTTTGFAQPIGVTISLPDEMAKVGTRALNRATWNGSLSTTLGLLEHPGFREAWDISGEQYQQITAIQRDREYRSSPEYLEIEAEMDKQLNEPPLRGADERTRMDKFLECQEKLSAIGWESRGNALDSFLTAEQKQKIREFELVNMSNWRFISFHSFEAFDLTDAQRQELEAIKKEFEPEFERQLQDFVNREDLDNQMHRMVKAEFERQGGGDYKEFNARQGIIRAKMQAENPEFNRMHEKMVAERELFAVQFRTKMFDVLTDEQWDRFQELLDNPPDYINAWRKRLKEAEEAAKKAGAWQPGPGSWRPGDPIPEQYRQQRNERRRFPRTEEGATGRAGVVALPAAIVL